MKKTKQLLTLTGILLLNIAFYSCQKETSFQNQNSPIANSSISQRIISWLNSRKSTTKPTTATNRNSSQSSKDDNIDLLSQNLDFSNVSTAVLDNKQDLIVVPINDAVKTKRILTKLLLSHCI